MATEKQEMVRTRYVGAAGELKDRRLGGLGHIQSGHAVDMPRRLAEEMIAKGLFVLEGDYVSGQDEPNEKPDVAEEAEGAMQTFVEVAGAMAGGEQSFVEVGAGEALASWKGDGPPLTAGDLPGLGEFKREALARAGVGDWQALAALSDEECARLAERLAGISAGQLKQWRDGAAAGLSKQPAGSG